MEGKCFHKNAILKICKTYVQCWIICVFYVRPSVLICKRETLQILQNIKKGAALVVLALYSYFKEQKKAHKSLSIVSDK